jgi:hypothetical protein
MKASSEHCEFCVKNFAELLILDCQDCIVAVLKAVGSAKPLRFSHPSRADWLQIPSNPTLPISLVQFVGLAGSQVA